MRILIIGGNGNISWWCAKVALDRGHEVTAISRGLTWKTRRPAHTLCRYLSMDVDDSDKLRELLETETFDLICDFLALDPSTISRRLSLIAETQSKYVLISSTIVFERNETTGFLVEDSPVREIGWNSYIDAKLRIEKLIHEHTFLSQRTLIVRPSHTYDTNVPTPLGSNCFTEIHRVLRGGNLLMPEQCNSRWTLMHSEDFALALIALVENENCFGNTLNLVADNSLSWSEIANNILDILGLPRTRFQVVATQDIESVQINDQSSIRGSNLGPNFKLHRKWNDEYDITKLQEFIPNWKCSRSFYEGFSETYHWMLERPIRQRINHELEKVLQELQNKSMQ